MKRSACVLLATASLLVAAGCSSSGGGSKPSDASQASGGGSVAPETKATGAPISVGFINVQGASTGISIPEATAGAQAAVSYVNSHGGVKGRPLSLKTCFEDQTPASWTNCGNRLVAEKPVAVIQGTDPGGGAVPILTKAGIPFIANQPSNVTQLSIPRYYSLFAGIPGVFLEAAEYAHANGYKKVAGIGIDSPAITAPWAAFGQKALKSYGIKSTFTAIPATTATFDSQANAATSGNPDLVVVVEAPQQCPGLIQALNATGFKGKVMMHDYCVSSAATKAIGSQSNYLASVFGTFATSASDPDVTLFKNAMAKYQKSAAVDTASASAFANIMSFVNVLTKADVSTTNLTADVVNTAFEQTKDVTAFMTGSKTFSCGAKLIPEMPQVCSNATTIVQIKNGSVTTADKSYPIAVP